MGDQQVDVQGVRMVEVDHGTLGRVEVDQVVVVLVEPEHRGVGTEAIHQAPYERGLACSATPDDSDHRAPHGEGS